MRRMITGTVIPLTVLFAVSLAIAAAGHTFTAALTGQEEVPGVTTAAIGEAGFTLGKEGRELTYTLTVKDMANVTAAHIHKGGKGTNGPPVANLFTGPKKTGAFNGTLSEGVLTANDLAGPLYGKTLDDLVTLIKTGEAYVNVHTDAYPAGEVRGQIK